VDNEDTDTGDESEETTQPADGGDDRDRSNESEPNDELRRLRGEARAMRKERNTFRDKLKELEDQGKSESQRTRDALDEATRRAERAETRLTRHEVAAEVGLSAKWADRLRGDTREEMVSDAKTLLEEVGGGGDTSGRTDFHGGVRQPVKGRPQSMNDVLRQAAGRR
jgi:hypothetical protein